ncbi:GntR family transcriptional regulator [Emcibacter sp.]|uniref:GntR family transcriptional regulator n=1 Tax=Emcibacter sp. TaxID=1979954 RepID=UPI003A94E430
MTQKQTAKNKTESSAPTSAKEVTDWIRDRIKIGQFVPGQRLVEADIIKTLNIPRSKVREAFQRLEAEGLIIIEEFRGASVKQLSIDEIRQIYRTRMALEGLAAAEFATKGTPDQKKDLSELQAELNKWVDSGDHDHFARLNNAWHNLIIEGAGNDYIRQFLDRLAIPIYRLLFSTFYSSKRIIDANNDHQVITAAITEGRADDAEKAMRDHISQGLESISEIDARFYRS